MTPTISLHSRLTRYGATMKVWLDSTHTCQTCDGRGKMLVRTGHFLLDVAFKRCKECRGSGISGSYRRIL